MICPWCGSDNIACRDSRPRAIGRRRRYHCMSCAGRFSTMELPVDLDQELARREKARAGKTETGGTA